MTAARLASPLPELEPLASTYGRQTLQFPTPLELEPLAHTYGRQTLQFTTPLELEPLASTYGRQILQNGGRL